jgi:ubiquinol-cytochrome c reductase cytochrome b subunit
VFLIVVIYVIFFKPLIFMHPANFEQANPLQTPEHIVPEWYLLPFYTILRVTPGKTAGIVLMGASLIVLFLLPFLSPKNSKSWH